MSVQLIKASWENRAVYHRRWSLDHLLLQELASNPNPIACDTRGSTALGWGKCQGQADITMWKPMGVQRRFTSHCLCPLAGHSKWDSAGSHDHPEPITMANLIDYTDWLDLGQVPILRALIVTVRWGWSDHWKIRELFPESGHRTPGKKKINHSNYTGYNVPANISKFSRVPPNP